MARLEDLTRDASVKGILPDCLVTVVSVQWFGSEALELTYKTPAGKVANEPIYRHDEPRIEVAEHGRPWSFDGDGSLFRLVCEAHRIRLAHLFDPVLAVHTSVVEPLPHQITAVYESMLPRQPLRFLLADDPGAGKTIMAGLLMKELIARGDLQRCLVVCPGSLVEQWQDELYRRFHLPFEILTNDELEAARTGNWFLETNLVIARLDKLSRNEDVQEKLRAPDCRWDLIVCDEAHKMSATFFGGESKYTKRYKLGQLLSTLTRHFLLMTATPHNGKEEDFQLFVALLDGDRFEGRFRDEAHTVPYKLSDPEAVIYKEVTDYVREEFNRAEALQNDKRGGTVGFALTILQRRLASYPEAIYQSLRRRRERLENRLRELELLQRGAALGPVLAAVTPDLDVEDVEDLEDAPDNEVAAAEEEILDQATAARTIAELKAEIETLRRLESLAHSVRRSGEDRKWRELASLLGEIFTPAAIANQIAETAPAYGANTTPRHVPSPRQKLELFTEHRESIRHGHPSTLHLGWARRPLAARFRLPDTRKQESESRKQDTRLKGEDGMTRLPVDQDRLARLCQRHYIRRLSLFGSVLAGADRPDSDVDFLVEFEPGKAPGLLGLAGIEAELSALLGGRPVDLRTAQDLSRHFRDEVERRAEVQYAG